MPLHPQWEVDELENDVAEIKTTFIEMEETQETMVADLQRKVHQVDCLEQLVAAQGEMIQVLRQGLDEQWVILLAMQHGRDHPIEIEDNSGDEEEVSKSDGGSPIWVPPPVICQLVPIEEDKEVGDLEIEEELAIEITAIDLAPAYTE